MQKRVTRRKAPRTRGKSSTLEVLGKNDSALNRIPAKWAEHYKRLSAVRDFFSGTRTSQGEHAKQELPTFGEHLADAATDSYDRDCALALMSSSQNALYEIEEALNRIANGTYGICEVTGQPIETPRLKAIPWTRFSLAAQEQLEARGNDGRAQLGKLGTCVKGPEPEDSDDEEETPVLDKAA